jgi:hypothetical protein
MKIRVTALDLKAVKAIAKCGFVGVDLKGEPWLESSDHVTKFRLRRLSAQGLVRSNQDGLLPGRGITQSYSLSKRGEEVANA